MATRKVQSVQTYCSLCWARCGVLARVENGRLVAVEADPQHPNAGICPKGSAAPEIVYSPDRLRRPLMRTRPKTDPDPGWKEISWDDALELVASNLKGIKERYGAHSVVIGMPAPGGSQTMDHFAWLFRLANAFGSPNVMAATHICNWHKDGACAYTFGTGLPWADYENSRCILLWGFNPQVSSARDALLINQARNRGAKLIAIDPRQVGAAVSADLWLRVRPGADGALALAMIHVLLAEGFYDKEFARDWTNGPFLVRSDTGKLLTEADLTAAGDANSFVVWDEKRSAPVLCRTPGQAERDGTQPALWGTYQVRLSDGRKLSCSTALTLLGELAANFGPERSEAITWVAPQAVYEAVRMFASLRPSSYYTRVGIEEHTNATQTNRAVSLFYALTGQLDTRGSNFIWQGSPTNPVDGRELLSQAAAERRLGRRERPLGPAAGAGYALAHDVYRAILRGEPYPVRGLLMFGGNILLSHADTLEGKKALETLEFYAQADLFMNPSSMFADIILPTCTCWESEGIRPSFYRGEATQTWAQLRKAVISPLYESKSDLKLIFELAGRLGLSEQFWGGDIEAAFNYHLQPSGITVEELRKKPGGIRIAVVQHERKFAMVDSASGKPRGFRTPSGRVEVYSVAFARAGYPALPVFEPPDARMPAEVRKEFPMVLTCSKLLPFIHTTFRNVPALRRQAPEPFLEINSQTADRLGIRQGDCVILETPQGSIRLVAKLEQWLDSRVVCTQHGWWDRCRELELPGYDPFSEQGANVNLLISSEVMDPISACVPHRSYPCRVRKAASEELPRASASP